MADASGNEQFRFRAADMAFASDSYEWLSVANHKAMFKGIGSINGAGNSGFMLSAVDSDLPPSTEADLFRIRIWDQDNADARVYDNEVGVGENADASCQPDWAPCGPSDPEYIPIAVGGTRKETPHTQTPNLNHFRERKRASSSHILKLALRLAVSLYLKRDHFSWTFPDLTILRMT